MTNDLNERFAVSVVCSADTPIRIDLKQVTVYLSIALARVLRDRLTEAVDMAYTVLEKP